MQIAEITKSFIHLQKRGLGIIIDDSSQQAKSVLFSFGQTISEARLNEMLAISASQVFVTLSKSRRQAFELAPMQRSSSSESMHRSAFPLCESVEAREGIHTGISIHDRTTTIKILSASEPNPKHIVKPGHIFPIEVVEGGVLVKPAVFEAASDIASLVIKNEVSAVVDLLTDEGSYCNPEQVHKLAAKHDIAVFALSSLVVYRLRTEQLIEKIAQSKLPVPSGRIFEVSTYRSKLNGVEHVSLSLGGNFDSGPVLTRVHREKLFSDIFEPLTGEHSSILGKSIAAIEQEGRGLIVYLRTPQQSAFLDSAASMNSTPVGRNVLFREFGVGAQIIKQCGVEKIILLSTSSAVPEGLENFGLEITALRQL